MATRWSQVLTELTFEPEPTDAMAIGVAAREQVAGWVPVLPDEHEPLPFLPRDSYELGPRRGTPGELGVDEQGRAVIEVLRRGESGEGTFRAWRHRPDGDIDALDRDDVATSSHRRSPSTW